MSTPTMIFNESTRNFVLEAFGLSVDPEGYIVEARNTYQRVLSINGSELKADKFAGIRRGSLLFFESDIHSLMILADRF